MASAKLQSFLEAAIEKGVAPGLVAVAFNSSTQFASAAAGVRDVTPGVSAPMTEDTAVWMASMSKTVSSLAALILAEKHGISLDSYEELVKVLPELKMGNGTPMSQIIDSDEPDSEGNFKMKDATVGITLRHLLTHSAGFAYDFGSDKMFKWSKDLPPLVQGAISAYSTPRLFEAGTGFCYGVNTDWACRFIERVSGLTLRKAFKTLVFDPLGVNTEELDVLRNEKMNENRSIISAKIGEKTWVPTPFDTTQFADVPPKDFETLGSAPLWGTLRAYASVIQSYLHESAPQQGGTPLLSKAMWDDACGDGLAKMGLSIPSPMMKSANPQVSHSVGVYATPKVGGAGEGWTMLQNVFYREETASGLKPGTIGWAGLANSYYFIDKESGVGGVILAQFLAFWDPEMVQLRDAFESWVIENAPKA
ncbi:beta-lactamase/transpeptidase-like protein [Meredithblackwellia eburnea MCA 4105]